MIIKNIIDIFQNLFNIYGYLLLDNQTTYNMLCNKITIKIGIIHNLTVQKLIMLIQFLNNHHNRIFDMKIPSLIYNINNTIINCTLNNNQYFTIQFIKSNDKYFETNTLQNIYYNIQTNEIISYNNMIPKIISNFNNYINNIITTIDINNVDFDLLIDLLTLYCLYEYHYIELIINSIINKINCDKKFKKKIQLEHNDEYKFYKLILLFNNLELNCKLKFWINLFSGSSYNILNKIFYDIEYINLYSLEEINTEMYIKLILLSKYNIFNNKYVDYINKYYSSKLLDFENITRINKLEDYRNLKKSYISNPFDELIKKFNFGIDIKNFFNIMCILTCTSDTYNIESLKIAYIFKKFKNLNHNELDNIFILYNTIITIMKLPCVISNDNYLYKLINIWNQNNKMKNLEHDFVLKIPLIKKKYDDLDDNIDIIDYQDALGLIYEAMYISKFDYNLIDIEEYWNMLTESTISNIRSNNMMKNLKSINIDEKLEDYMLNEFKFNISNNIENDYKTKYKKQKRQYLKLKIIEKKFENNIYDKEILFNSNELTEEIIDEILLGDKIDIDCLDFMDDSDSDSESEL